MDIMDGFNPVQRAAVEYCEGASLVIAGAGSGKTRVLTHKISYLLQNGYMPGDILALTFTNKAAREMKDRIARIIDDESKTRYIWMGTFHSIFLRILRTEHERIGFSSNFTIYDTADSKSLLSDIMREMELGDKYKSGAVLNEISNAKNRLVTAEEYIADNLNYLADKNERDMPLIGEIYKKYSDRCRTADAMDFDDILLFTYILFEKNEDIRRKYVERFKYVLVDEYQDTNYAQHQIVWLLTKERQRVCVVGDDAQSIYSFRGANIDNILTFRDLYKDSKIFKLEQNYRSTQMIVEAANSLIKKNRGQIKKNVFSCNDVGERIKVTENYSDIEEGQVVVRQIGGLCRSEGCAYSDFAILYRTNAQSRVLEEALRKSAIPYKIFGGLSFFQRKEIKDIIAYLRLCVNPNDEEALKRVINYPTRGIGDTTLRKLKECAGNNMVSLWSVISEPERYELGVSKATCVKLGMFHALISGFIEDARSLNVWELGQKVINDTGIKDDIYRDKTPENLSRQENVEELIGGMNDFCEGRMEEDESALVEDYLSEVSLVSDLDSDKDDDPNKVTLMTVHSAKGLEFNTVFVVGLEEGLFPSDMARSHRDMEEERRLFYVALTRAEKHCFISYAKSRYRYGKLEFADRSRFIGDISPDCLDMSGVSGGRSSFSSDKDVELPWKRKSVTQRDEYPSANVGAGRADSFSSFMNRRVVTEKKPEVMSQPSGVRRITRVTDADVGRVVAKSPGESDKLAVGKVIEHQRFGVGVIEALDGRGDDTKVTVAFKNLGRKQLLVKYAKFKVLN